MGGLDKIAVSLITFVANSVSPAFAGDCWESLLSANPHRSGTCNGTGFKGAFVVGNLWILRGPLCLGSLAERITRVPQAVVRNTFRQEMRDMQKLEADKALHAPIAHFSSYDMLACDSQYLQLNKRKMVPIANLDLQALVTGRCRHVRSQNKPKTKGHAPKARHVRAFSGRVARSDYFGIL